MNRVAAQRGAALRCLNWRAEALLRMLENVLEVGERPEDLIVYASLGKAARNTGSYHAIVKALTELREDETLVLQSGKPVAVFPTSAEAPMVVSAVNNMVGSWQTPERFYELAQQDKTMWGGLTAGAWQYIGSQGVLQGNYELYRAAIEEHFGGNAEGRWMLTAGLGGMGSAQPLAASMAGLSSITVEADIEKIKRVSNRGSIDVATDSLPAAIAAMKNATSPIAVALNANAATVYPQLLSQGIIPDMATDMTSAHDARFGYIPPDIDLEALARLRAEDPEKAEKLAVDAMAQEVAAILGFAAQGAVVFENGNNIRIQAQRAGVADAFEIRGFMERYLRPLFCRAIGPFRWVALSGSRADLARIDDLVVTTIERPEVHRWIKLASEHVPVQGLPARSCWLGHRERSKLALAVNKLVAIGEITAPVLFTRDHLDAAGMTHPRIGTEAMRDGSDGISDWPILDAMLMASNGADLVAVHAGGGGYSGWMASAGVSLVADGTEDAAGRIARSLDADTGLGVVRYAEAGYELAIEAAQHTPWLNNNS